MAQSCNWAILDIVYTMHTTRIPEIHYGGSNTGNTNITQNSYKIAPDL